MSDVTRMLTEDLGAAVVRLKLNRGLEVAHRPAPGEKPKRQRELHVSDFVKSEKSFCVRALVWRWVVGEVKVGARGERHATPTWVQWDGKFREEKWKVVMQAAGILREYQPEFKLGMLVGHPDFTIDAGEGDQVLDLTGYDKAVDPILRSTRLAAKKRQVLLYLAMAQAKWQVPQKRGYVLSENKGDCTFDVIPVEMDPQKVVDLLARVKVVSTWCLALQRAEAVDRAGVFREVPGCGKDRCRACQLVAEPVERLEPGGAAPGGWHGAKA